MGSVFTFKRNRGGKTLLGMRLMPIECKEKLYIQLSAKSTVRFLPRRGEEMVCVCVWLHATLMFIAQNKMLSLQYYTDTIWIRNDNEPDNAGVIKNDNSLHTQNSLDFFFVLLTFEFIKYARNVVKRRVCSIVYHYLSIIGMIKQTAFDIYTSFYTFYLFLVLSRYRFS